MSKIEQLIDEIEEYVEGCKPAPFSQSKIVVQKEQLYELLTELRLKTPDEIKRYQKIIAQKDKIISDAQAQAEQMIEETTAYANALVEEHEIMLKAYEKAEQTINAANAQAQAIVDAANQNAEETRVGALTYAQDLIANIQNIVSNSLAIARSNSEGLINGLSENMELLVSNHEALAAQVAPQAEMPVIEDMAPVRPAAPAPEAEEEEDEEEAYEDEEELAEDDEDYEDEADEADEDDEEDDEAYDEDDEDDDDFDDDDFDDID